MAYLAFDDIGLAPVEARAPMTVPVTVPVTGPVADPLTAPARLGPLEWAVVALARRDALGSLRRPGRLAVALRTVFRSHNPRLADARLEALRRIAVLSWHYGYTVPSREVQAFLAAGFTADQYDLLLGSIGTAKAQDRRR